MSEIKFSIEVDTPKTVFRSTERVVSEEEYFTYIGKIKDNIQDMIYMSLKTITGEVIIPKKVLQQSTIKFIIYNPEELE